MSKLTDKILYVWLKRPLTLAKPIDEGQGSPTIVLLHGIGRTGKVWQHVIAGLTYLPCRVVAYDLLGFGASPKPDWVKYDIDDHAKAVINSLERLNSRGPFILVGHSMGCLIAVRVARLRPDMVKHLVLYEMPLYSGLPQKKLYSWRLGIYARVYNWIINYQPTFDPVNALRAERLARRVVGFEVDRETWVPFKKSLENSIMTQTAAEDIKHLNVAIDVIYGTLDMLVIRGRTKKIFGSDIANITSHKVRASHTISLKASRLIAERIAAAISAPTVY